MAVEQTTIQGKVRGPNGEVATKGRVIAELSAPASIEDTATGFTDLIGGIMSFDIASDGTVTDFKLSPNDAMTPSTTFWKLTFVAEKPSRWIRVRHVTVPTAPDPSDIGDLPEV